MTERHVLLIRHAKAEHATDGQDDFDRPLSPKGVTAATRMGMWVTENAPAPDLVLCSAARRTAQTCSMMQLAGDSHFLRHLYLAEPEHLLSVLQNAAELPCIALIGHNPGIAMTAARLLSERPEHPQFAKFPTGAVALIRVSKVPEWGAGQLEAFITPRDLDDSHVARP